MQFGSFREFQSPIGWGLSCEIQVFRKYQNIVSVSIPYWLGSKLREYGQGVATIPPELFQSPIGWGLSCEVEWSTSVSARDWRFNPLLVGV